MNAVDHGPSERHLERLERQVRWLTSVVVILTLAYVALLAWQFYPRTQPLQAPGFIVVDAAGRRRAELSLYKDGTPMLRLDNEQERARVLLFLRPDGSAGVRLADPEGENRAELSLSDRGMAELSLAGPDGRSIARLGARSDSAASLRLVDPSRGRPWTAP